MYIENTPCLIEKMNGSISLLPFCHSQTLVDVSALTFPRLIGDHFQRIVYSRYFEGAEYSLDYENHLDKKANLQYLRLAEGIIFKGYPFQDT